MAELANEVGSGPYRFTVDDLAPERLQAGASRTLADFYNWRDSNPDLIGEHIELHSQRLDASTADFSRWQMARRRLSPHHRETFDYQQTETMLGFFCLYNLAELPDIAAIRPFLGLATRHETNVKEIAASSRKGGAMAVVAAIESRIPELAGTSELPWIGERMDRLSRILPEKTLQEGGMGKAARTLAGVLTIGVLDTRHEDSHTRREHLCRIVPAAFAYAATYPIIDDTLQDGNYVSSADRRRYHDAILEGIRTGMPFNMSTLPNHPLSEELARAHASMLDAFPRDDYPHLYNAGEAMFLAQERDSQHDTRNPPDVLASLYPDIFVKASMSRVIANIIGRRSPPTNFYNRCPNVNFVNQLRDDFGDYRQDAVAGRLTPFTYLRKPDDTNPLYDLFAYSAYVSNRVFDGDKDTDDLLTTFSANRLAVYLARDPEFAGSLERRYQPTSAMADFIRLAGRLPARLHNCLQRVDFQFAEIIGDAFRSRTVQDTDPRTFISDRVDYIDNTIARHWGTPENDGHASPITEIGRYALEGGGKRLRPAMSLMLAESLDIERGRIEPLLAAIEFFHTASLVFDDLPAQDNAKLRRGNPTVHTAYDESGAQLTGIALLSKGFGCLAELQQHYPADRVAAVVEYFGNVLGPQRLCLGQYIDLHAEAVGPASIEEVLEMYRHKTSALLEAALVPVLILEDGPDTDIQQLKAFASHAGIVFQLRDDILDATSTAEYLGKDTGNDAAKANIVRSFGVEAAISLMDEHLGLALESCRKMTFNSRLLQETVRYFASRLR